MDETQPQAPVQEPPARKNNVYFLIGGIVVLTILCAVGIFFLLAKPKTSKAPVPPSSQSTLPPPIPTIPTGGPKIPGPRVVDTVPKEFTVEMSNRFAPSVIMVKQDDTIHLTVTNTEGTREFVLEEFGVKTKQLKAGESETIKFVAKTVGTFEYYATDGSTRQAGMTGQFTVQ